MSFSSIYISSGQLDELLADLNVDALDEDQRQDLHDRAVGDFESDMCVRFNVPIASVGGGLFSASPAFARQKVLNAVKAKIRQIIGLDKNRNLVIDSTQKFIDVHDIAYKGHIKDLLDPRRVFGFQLNTQSADSMEPVQKLGLGRADNELEVENDPTLPTVVW